jgi:tRNA threonylcarbamoyladenosine biosynthesis protein TsaB
MSPDHPSGGGGIILGIESSGTTGSVALLGPDRLLASLSFASATLYSQRLLPSIEWLLARVGAQPGAITAVAVSKGPGSFTGLRIGMSVAKAIAFANEAPIVGVSTLEALALRGAGILPDAPICPVLDARQGEIYAGLFRALPGPEAPAGRAALPGLTRLREDHAGRADALADWITGPTLFLGEGALRYEKELRRIFGANFVLAPRTRILPSAEEVAALGAARLDRGEQDDLAMLEPDYLRRSYAETRRIERRDQGPGSGDQGKRG